MWANKCRECNTKSFCFDMPTLTNKNKTKLKIKTVTIDRK